MYILHSLLILVFCVRTCIYKYNIFNYDFGVKKCQGDGYKCYPWTQFSFINGIDSTEHEYYHISPYQCFVMVLSL